MFGFGKKKELFTLDKLFSGFGKHRIEVDRLRESVGFKKMGNYKRGEWSNISWIEIIDSESMELNPHIISSYITIDRYDYDKFINILNGCRQISFKFSDLPHEGLSAFIGPLKDTYSGWVLPNGHILSQGYIYARRYYQFQIYNPLQIIFL